MAVGTSTILSMTECLFLKSAIENYRKGFVLTCLGSYCLPLRPIPVVSKMGELSLLSLNEVVTPRSIALV